MKSKKKQPNKGQAFLGRFYQPKRRADLFPRAQQTDGFLSHGCKNREILLGGRAKVGRDTTLGKWEGLGVCSGTLLV